MAAWSVTRYSRDDARATAWLHQLGKAGAGFVTAAGKQLVVAHVRACWPGGGLSYLRGMTPDAGSQFSVAELIAAALGLTALGGALAGLLAALLHALLHTAGALVTRARGEKKFSWLLALVAVGLAVLVGGWTGLKIGVVRAALPVAKESGPKMVEQALQDGLRQAGLTNYAQLEVRRLRELVDKAESMPLPPLEQMERFRPQFEEARAKLLPAAKALLDAQAPDGKLVLSDAVAKLWPKVFDELAAWERRFRRWEIITGLLWIVGIEAIIAAVCLALRLTRDPQPAGPPKLPER